MSAPEPDLPPLRLREVEVQPEEDGLPSEPEVKTPEKAGQPGVKLDRFARFKDGLEAACQSSLPIRRVGSVIWKNVERLHTPLGRFKEELEKHAVAPSGPAVPFDLLPISLEGVEDLKSLTWAEQEWALAICLVLYISIAVGSGTPNI